MASFISTLLFLLLAAGGTPPAVSQSSEASAPVCYDWGESSEGAVSVLEGEAGWLSCPLFSHPSVYNYTSTQSAGHNFLWYRVPEGHDLEQPILYSWQISRDRDRLWLQPATANDSGQYICMLSNKSSCSKISIRLKVLLPDEVVRDQDCEPPVAVAPTPTIIAFQTGGVLDCPDLRDARKMADGETKVTWSHKCYKDSFASNRQQKGDRLQIHLMLGPYQGLYFCRVQYERTGRTLHFTRSINVSAVYPPTLPKLPIIIYPGKDQVYPVKQNTDVPLVCTGLFPYLNSSWDIWWTVDGKTLDKLDQQRFSKTNRRVKYDYGDRTEESVLLIQDFQSEDLDRDYSCSVRNQRGFETRRARLKEEEGEEV